MFRTHVLVCTGIRAGRLRQIEPSILQFCYHAAVSGTYLDGSALKVEVLDATAQCDSCQLVFPVEEHWFECPHCHSFGAKVVTGNELQLTSVELIPSNAPVTTIVG